MGVLVPSATPLTVSCCRCRAHWDNYSDTHKGVGASRYVRTRSLWRWGKKLLVSDNRSTYCCCTSSISTMKISL